MTSVHVCHCCGRTIDNDFLYCPWCGQARVQKNESLDSVFEQLEVMQCADRNNRLTQMQTQLDQLEKELNTLVLSTEMHK